MVTVESMTLWIHIAAGFLALFAGLGAIVTQKGGQRHRRSGRVYVGAMAVVSGTALALFPMDPSFDRGFLSLIAVFSFYFAFSGYRVLSRKRPADDPGTVDWAAVSLLGLASAGLFVLGAVQYVGGSGFATVLLVFGGIGTVFAVSDVRKLRADVDRGAWVSEHLTRMGAGYIATVTAFSTVNFLFLPVVARWLWPTLVGTPLLFVAASRYERTFAPGSASG
jgi:uncharacterized membrane protein